MSTFIDAYALLLIKQYWEQPNARAEIAAQAATWEDIRDILRDFETEFDIDQATGDRLDIIGKIVGIPRLVPLAVAKIAFGFSENPNGRRFDDKFLTIAGSAPFQDRFEPAYTTLELDDNNYRAFLKAKIALNNGSAFMVSDSRITIQDVISAAFEGDAFGIDRRDMSLALYVSPVFDLARLLVIQRLGLLPKPQGVRYYSIVQATPGETFGFSDNPNALGFADKFDAAQLGGRFALKVI